MSDLTDRIAADHAFGWQSTDNYNLPAEVRGLCTCGFQPADHAEHTTHVSEVTEQAVRERANRDIDGPAEYVRQLAQRLYLPDVRIPAAFRRKPRCYDCGRSGGGCDRIVEVDR